MAILIDSEYGQVTIANDVVASIAGAVATKSYGVVGMAAKNRKDGLVSLLKFDNMSKGVKVTAEDGGIVITMHIMVEYGVNIKAICDSIIHNVEYKIEKNVGLKVKKVEVIVESVRCQD